jgi:hypothetical protein
MRAVDEKQEIELQWPNRIELESVGSYLVSLLQGAIQLQVHEYFQ